MPDIYKFILEDARKFRKIGKWFRDDRDRYLLFRGVNFGSRSKLPPYLPVFPFGFHVLSKTALMEELDAVKDSLAHLKRLGFNVVRLVVQWKGISPHPDTIASEPYLDAVRIIVEKLFALGVYSIIDFHQDIASEKYGGDGFPDWALQHPPSPPPHVRPDRRWTLRYMDLPLPTLPFVLPTLNVMVRRTLRSFWKNRTRNGMNQFPTQDMLIKSIRRTAEAFSKLEGVLGYEPFNEPDPVSFPAKKFEQQYLGGFYREVIDDITAVDTDSFVFLEPRVDWTVGKRPPHIKTYLPSDLQGDKTVFAFHYYDTRTQLLANLCIRDNMAKKGVLWTRVFKSILKAADDRHLIPFMTEYGCDYFGAWQGPCKFGGRDYERQSRAYMDLSLQQIEANLLNSTLWTFDLYASLQHNDNWNDEDSSLLDRNRRIRDPDIVARPYPMRSSAEPFRLSFDSLTGCCVMVFEGKPVKDPTVIYVPDELHYKGGFDVFSTSGRVEWDKRNHLLYWYPDPDQARHQVIICPKSGFAESMLPPESKALISQTKRNSLVQEG